MAVPAEKVDCKKQKAMILKLRNRHRHAWMALAVLLPIGFVVALANRPEAAVPNDGSVGRTNPFPERQTIASAENEAWRAEVLKAQDGKMWLEAHFKTAAQRPLSTLYLAPQAGASPADAVAAGAVGPRGLYQYRLDSLIAGWQEYYLFFYDQVRREAYSETQLTKSR